MRPRHPVLVVIFWVYAAALFTATHWPSLRIDGGPVPRPDLFIHFGAFGCWTFLLWASGLTGGRVLLTAGIAATYSALDELSQGVPILHRTVTWQDAAANLGGVTIGAVAAWAVSRWLAGRDLVREA